MLRVRVGFGVSVLEVLKAYKASGSGLSRVHGFRVWGPGWKY